MDEWNGQIDTAVELQHLEQQIRQLFRGNIHSPKQVAQAIFGNFTRSGGLPTETNNINKNTNDTNGNSGQRNLSSRTSLLQQVARGQIHGVNADRQRLAALIVQYRSLTRRRHSSTFTNLSSGAAAAATTKTTTTTTTTNSSTSPRTTRRNGSRNAKLRSREYKNEGRLLSTVNHDTIDNVEEEEENEILTDNDWESEEPNETRDNPFESASRPLRTSRSLTSTTAPATYESTIEKLFGCNNCQIDPDWKEALLQISRPQARALVTQLDASGCPMGFDPLAQPTNTWSTSTSSTTNTIGILDSSSTATSSTTTAGKKGTFLAFCREQKQLYPDCILLVRCGDFYETFGVDACLLVEHTGLNPMAGKAKAGCPIRNIQGTLDGLTRAGFRVAVFEEGTDTDASSGPVSVAGVKGRIKERFLAQIVSPAQPIYLYDLVLTGTTDWWVSAPPARPYVGIVHTNAGYTIVEVSMEERSVRVLERLTAEAVACRLAAYPPAEPVFYVPPPGDDTNRLPFDSCRSALKTRFIPPSLVPTTIPDDVQRAKHVIVTSLLQAIERQDQDGRRSTVDDFVTVSRHDCDNSTGPLYMETALQLGLMNDPAIPSLVSYALGTEAPAATKRFLRRWLLHPPPPAVTDAMRILVEYFLVEKQAVYPWTIPPVGKILALLRAGQASAHVYGELLQTMHSITHFLNGLESPRVVEAIMTLLEFESGMAADLDSLKQRCNDAVGMIEDVISVSYHVSAMTPKADSEDCISSFGCVIPKGFLERNECPWRGRVRPGAAQRAYQGVERSALKLAEAIAVDFYGTPLSELLNQNPIKTPVVQDVFNNLIALKEIPTAVDRNQYFHPRDRNGKVIKNRYTTEKVQSALSDYVSACDSACQDVSSVLVELSNRLQEGCHIPTIVQAAHANLILSSAYYHASRANYLGWELARTYHACEEAEDCAGEFAGLWPYWMGRSQAVANSFKLSGMWLLTAPNMSGKSTIMRSTAAAALLTACGLCAPLQKESRIRRFDHLFVRGASADVPTEQKSAFGGEMADVAALLRCCGANSLVFVDELGRGTSPRDGTRLAGAILEAMAETGMSGIFATHLHGIFDFPLRSQERIMYKRMAIHDDEHADNYEWTYRLEDGICTDSMALLTAERFGLPKSVIDRARDLSRYLPNHDLNVPQQTDEQRKNASGDEASSIVTVTRTAEAITGQPCLPIPPKYMPPASLDGKSSVYLLALDTDPPLYYVGETDNFRRRIQQHRLKGGPWSTLTAAVMPAPNGKSQARDWEGQIIQALAQHGVFLRSVNDGRSRRVNERFQSID